MLHRLFSRLRRSSEQGDRDGAHTGGLVAVWSPKSEGASVVAAHLARVLSSHADTLLIDLNLRRPHLGKIIAPEVSGDRCVDRLWPLAQVDTLTPQALRSVVGRNPDGSKGLAFLAGTRQPEDAAERHPTEVDTLLRVATTAFRSVVVDVGADLDNGATEAALRRADRVLVVTRASLISMEQYQLVRHQAEQIGLDPSTHRLLVTCRLPDDPFSPTVVAKVCGPAVIGILPYVPRLTVAADLGEAVWNVDRSRGARQFEEVLRRLEWGRSELSQGVS